MRNITADTPLCVWQITVGVILKEESTVDVETI
jgi:hypothetical protein